MMRYILLLMLLPVLANAQGIDYPSARVDTVRDVYFGDTVSDPYRWLEDEKLPATQAWVDAEQKISEKYLGKVDTRYALSKQLSLNSWADVGTLLKTGKYYFDFTNDMGPGMPSSMYIKEKINEKGARVFNPSEYRGHNSDKVAMRGFSISRDNKYLAFALSFNGSDWQEIHVKDLETNTYKDEPDVVKDVKFSGIWWRGHGFFYLRYPKSANILKDELGNCGIYYHQLGTRQSDDRLIYKEEQSPRHHFRFRLTPSGQNVVIYGLDTSGSLPQKEVLVMDLASFPDCKPDTLISTWGRESYGVIGEYKGKFLVMTNDASSTYRLMLYDMHSKNKATEFIPPYRQVMQDANIVGDKIVCVYTDDIDYSLVTYDSNGKAMHKVNFPEGTSVAGVSSAPSDSVTLFYSHSFIHPPIAYEYNVNTYTLDVVQKTKILYDLKDFDMKKVYCTSKDGTKIPMVLAFKKGLRLDGNNPALLYGYGGYGILNTPFYSRGFMTFMQNGGVVAVPCIRGGGELGEQWHIKGCRLNKQNSFDDFIAAAEFLSNEKYTNKDLLTIMGGSNGGLLVAAVLNKRPDICKVAIAENGVYDMLRYQRFTIGEAWRSEYGSSDNNKQDFRYLKDYSPVHNVKDTSYPAVLVLTGDHDDRVVPLHSFKYVAALQKQSKGTAPLLLYMRENAGHQRNDLETDAYVYSFIYNEIGIKPGKLHWKTYY